jgi:DNA-binding beta-propeller fold protein YncE
LGGEQRDLAYDGTHLWVTDMLADRGFAISAQKDSIRATIKLADSPWGVAFAGNGVWVSALAIDRIYKINRAP